MKGRKGGKVQQKIWYNKVHQITRESTDISLENFLLEKFFSLSHVTKSKAGKVEAKRFSSGISAFLKVFAGLSSSCTPFG